MTVKTISAGPFEGQKPGASGLRKRRKVFQEPHYLECSIAVIFKGIAGRRDKTPMLGGGVRFYTKTAIQAELKMAAADGVSRVIVGRDGLLSTPTASHLFRLRGCVGGIILSASHNPGGPDGDFGVKFDTADGDPPPGGSHRPHHAATG